jgi:hypothetical protein
MSDMPASDTLQIETAEQYREAVAEMQRLDSARPGTPEFERKRVLGAALFDYEQRHLRPGYRPGRPRKSTGP